MSKKGKRVLKSLLKLLHINLDPVVKVYHGYGDEDLMIVYGHVFRQSPMPKSSYKKNIWSNTMSLMRLFMAIPLPHAKVRLNWGTQTIEAVTDTDGFFRLEWKSETITEKGWHLIRVELVDEDEENEIFGEGKILIPYATQYAYVSDIDDTFLVSHSSKMEKRLYLLFTKNARTRKPFEGVVHHYQLLAQSGASPGAANPFFFVSCSEWNLYEYIKEFCRNYELPEGVYLLNQLKQLHELFKTGQSKHSGKFMRIARLLKEFPHRKFVLLGDDTQHDPDIYTRLVELFSNQIVCVYWRHIRRSRKAYVEELMQKIKSHGVEVCYFKHSAEAIAHSKTIGLIETI